MYENLTATIVAIDERASALLGWSAEEMVGHRSLEFVHPDDQERAIGQWLVGRAGASPDALVALADQAMYRAKETGGDRVHRHGQGDAPRV